MWPAVSATVIALASVLSYPEEGSEPMGRAGAWVARASDPIALARNPAGLAGQPARMSAGWDLAFRHSGSEPFPVGFLAVTLPVSEKLAIGTGIVTPHGVPRLSSPLLESQTLFAIPTIGVAYELAPDVRVGASFGWGMASVRTASPYATTYGTYQVTTLTTDLFVPRGTFGVHARGNDYVEVGASFMLSAPYSGSGQGRASATTFVDHRWYPKTELELAIPAEAFLGVRLRAPRGSGPRKGDPIDTEIGDVELDAAWSNDSAIDRYGRRFRDVVGFRLGGDLNVVPGAFAIRAGAFVTPRAAQPGAVALEAMGGTRIGLSAGATARVDKRFDVSIAYLHMFLGEQDGLDVIHLGVAYRF